MFEQLKNQVSILPTNGISFDMALELISDSFMENYFSEDEDDTQETITNLMALEASIKTFGLSRALLSFADHNKILSTSIPGIPSIESLTADLSVEDSTAAIEGVGTTIKSFVKAYFAGIAYNITHPLMSFSASQQTEQRLVIWKHIVDGIQSNMNEQKFIKEKAEKVINRVVPYESLMSVQKAYLESPQVLLKMWTLELPKTQEEFGPWLSKVKSLLEPVFKTEEATIKDNGTLSVPLKRWIVLKMGEKGNLVEKGYTSDETVKEVIVNFRKLLGAFDSLKTISKTVKTHIEAMTAEGKEFDRSVVNKACSIGKNLTKALIFHGLWGVSGMTVYTIGNLKKAYGKEAKEY